MQEKYRFVFVERCTLFFWFSQVVKALFRKLPPSSIHILYIEASFPAAFLIRYVAWLLPGAAERLDFRLVDVLDRNGNLVSFQIENAFLVEVLDRLQGKWDILFQSSEKEQEMKGFVQYLIKEISRSPLNRKKSIKRSLLLIHVVLTECSRRRFETKETLFYLDQPVWIEVVQKYAEKFNLSVVPCSGKSLFTSYLFLAKYLVSPYFFLRHVFRQIKTMGLSSALICDLFRFDSREEPSLGQSIKIACPCYAHLNIKSLELQSEQVFFQQSKIPGENFLLIKSGKQLELVKNEELKEFSIQVASFGTMERPVKHWVSCGLQYQVANTFNRSHKEKMFLRWAMFHAVKYCSELRYWDYFLSTYNVRIFVDWYKYGKEHCVIREAMRKKGGITAIYQRSFEQFSCPVSNVTTDIYFAFSQLNLCNEVRAKSSIRYHVTVGFIGDHRFPLFEKSAREVRNTLKKSGAKKIIAFFDENSLDDARWHTGHRFMQENYLFLLEKVLSEPWLGIVFKPKTPSTLRKRLGDVAAVLKQAEGTGRCLVIEGGDNQNKYPPAYAALAADLAIHGHVHAATAGVESALAGVPTLLLDREGCPDSFFYRVSSGEKIVFRDWESLWLAAKEYLIYESRPEDFGDWSSFLRKIDPFRDGRAAERMGTYLKWILEGYMEGGCSDKVMAVAAERYCEKWGADKISTAN